MRAAHAAWLWLSEPRRVAFGVLLAAVLLLCAFLVLDNRDASPP